MYDNVDAEMEVGTCAESHCLRRSTFTCFASVALSTQGLPHAHVLLRSGWKSSGCLSSQTGRCFGGACTDTTHCRQWGLCCPFYKHRDFRVSTQLHVIHILRVFAGASPQAATSTEKGKALRRGKISKKVDSGS